MSLVLMADVSVPANTGRAFTLDRGQHIRITAQRIVDFVAFNRSNLRERFDQARTKINAGKIFLSTNDNLVSKSNNVMLTIVEDTYKEGTHDLQAGMCSRASYLTTHASGLWPEVSPARKEDLPDHGCWENLSEALRPWDVAPEDIPSPFNVFQTMQIDCGTGALHFAPVKPSAGTYVEFRAEMDCLIAVSACPSTGEGGVRIQVFGK